MGKTFTHIHTHIELDYFADQSIVTFILFILQCNLFVYVLFNYLFTNEDYYVIDYYYYYSIFVSLALLFSAFILFFVSYLMMMDTVRYSIDLLSFVFII